MTAIATLVCLYRGDQAEYARKALQSIVDQRNIQQFESRIYLGIDGVLTPELEQLVSEFSARLHLVFRSQRNQGLAATLNELIARLGDEQFVFRMDADDESHPDRYYVQLSYLDAHPDIDILGTGIVEFSSESRFPDRVVQFCSGPEDARANIHKRVPVAHPTVCFRRRVLDRVGGYPMVGTNEDVALWFRCLLSGFRFDNVAGTYLRFRISSSFWKRRSWSKAASELACYVRGIYALHGPFSLRYAFPLVRFSIRVLPMSVSKYAYGSRFRRRAVS